MVRKTLLAAVVALGLSLIPVDASAGLRHRHCGGCGTQTACAPECSVQAPVPVVPAPVVVTAPSCGTTPACGVETCATYGGCGGGSHFGRLRYRRACR